MKKLRILINIVASALLLLLTWEYDGRYVGIVETLEKQSYDWRLIQGTDTVKKREDIVIVDIDNYSLQQLGDWPWTREKLAALNDQLFRKYQVNVAAYTIPFPDANATYADVLNNVKDQVFDKNSPDEKSLYDSIGVKQQHIYFALSDKFRRLRSYFDHNRQFANSLFSRNIVLGYSFLPPGQNDGSLPPPVKFANVDGEQAVSKEIVSSFSKKWPLERGYAANLPEFLEATKNAAGHINTVIDEDGLIRRKPYFVRHAGGYYPSLPLAVLRRMLQIDNEEAIDIAVGESFSGYQLEQIDIRSHRASLNPDGHVYLRFLGHGGRSVDFETTPRAVFRYLAAVDVINGDVAKDLLEDKIILIGSSSEQLREIQATPVNPAMPRVELLATELANLLDNRGLHRPASAGFHETLELFAILLVLSLVFVLVGPIFSAIILTAVIVAHTYYTFHLWDSSNVVHSMIPMIIAGSGLFILNSITGFIAQRRESKHLQSTFSQYVPPEFAKRMGQSRKAVNLEGEERELTVLFSDVRNFTSIAEQMTAREVTLLMNRLLTALTECIHRHDGTVDKYIGDSVMAFWNAPLEDEEHAEKAVLAALDMDVTMRKLSDEMVANGLPEMRLGVGLCTGDANVGNMGSKLRMTYTAIGDTVNLASRTESLTKHYGCAILVTETTYEKQEKQGVLFRIVDIVRVKGRQTPVTLYEPIGQTQLIPPERINQLQTYESMRQAYVAGNFQKSLDLLTEYQKDAPNDKIADVYAKRLQHLMASEKPPQWDGITTHGNK